MKQFLTLIFIIIGSTCLIGQAEFKIKLDNSINKFLLPDIKIERPTLFLKHTYSLKEAKSLIIPPNYSFKRMGFFCKTEIRLQKKVIFPVKFRLGTLDYVNHLEYNR